MKIKEIEFGISITCVLWKRRNSLIRWGIIGGKEEIIKRMALSIVDDLGKLASKNSFKLIELQTMPPFDAEILWEIKDDLKRIISPFDVTYHLPGGEINIAAINPRVREASINEIKSLIDLAAELEIKKILMHPGSYTAMPEAYRRMERMIKQLAQKSIYEIFDYAKDRGISLSLENLEEIFFCSPEEFKPFVKRGIGLVLDTAHAMKSDVDPLAFVKKFERRISEVHLVDGKKGDVIHRYPFGSGEVNCLKVLDKLIEINYPGKVIFEEISEENLTKSLGYLKDNGYL